MVWQVQKKFIKRMPDHLHMEFGLFKRTSYEIPIKRISSIIVQRPVFSRISKRCFVDIINIGMGDEKEENTRLLLSIPEKHLPELLHRLLPEFDAYFTESDTAPIRPPKAIWWKKIINDEGHSHSTTFRVSVMIDNSFFSVFTVTKKYENVRQ